MGDNGSSSPFPKSKPSPMNHQLIGRQPWCMFNSRPHTFMVQIASSNMVQGVTVRCFPSNNRTQPVAQPPVLFCHSPPFLRPVPPKRLPGTTVLGTAALHDSLIPTPPGAVRPYEPGQNRLGANLKGYQIGQNVLPISLWNQRTHPGSLKNFPTTKGFSESAMTETVCFYTSGL